MSRLAAIAVGGRIAGSVARPGDAIPSRPMLDWSTIVVTLLLLVVACDCEAPSGGGSADEERAALWAQLSYCLAGTEEPSPELLDRIGLAAELEVVEDVPQPPGSGPGEGRMGEPPSRGRPPDMRRWPRRCAQYAHALEDALRDEPAEHPAHRVAEVLDDGEIDGALYTLVEQAGSWPAAAASGVPAPPERASPLARAGAPVVVAGPRCVVTTVLPDTSVSPTRHVAQVACGDGAHHHCIVSGEALDRVSCAPADDLADVWSLTEAQVGEWTLEARRRREHCTYVASRDEEAVFGEADCGERGTWTRPCRVGDFAGAAFVHLMGLPIQPSKVAVFDGDVFRLIDSPVYAQGNVVVSCEPGAMRFHVTDSRQEFVDEEMRPGMIRPPVRSFVVVEAHRCTPAGCETTSAEVIAHGSRGSAAPLAEGVVVVELSSGDEGDGLIAHVAPHDALGDSPARWVLDPADGATLGLVGSFEWAVGERAVVLFVSDEARGLLALRFDAEGTVSYLAPMP